jgi:hypothetical protein
VLAAGVRDTGCILLVAEDVCEIGCVRSVCVEGARLTGCGAITECVSGTREVAAWGRMRELDAAGRIWEANCGRMRGLIALGRLCDAACIPPCFFARPGGMQPGDPGEQPQPVFFPWLHPAGVPALAKWLRWVRISDA